MDIKARITARKVVLIYFYDILFFEYMRSNTHVFDDAEKVSKFLHSGPLGPKKNDDVANGVADHVRDAPSPYSPESFDHDVAYIIRHHFDHLTVEDVDMGYVYAIWPKMITYLPIVASLVDNHVTSFWFDQMDLIDRAIFVLWYSEWKELWTPKEVVLNEMIELAKRYGDSSSAKLVNGIGHNILHDGSWRWVDQ
jgi:transcription antitermination protein NusB